MGICISIRTGADGDDGEDDDSDGDSDGDGDGIAADCRVIPPENIYTGGKHLLRLHGGMHDKEQVTFAW